MNGCGAPDITVRIERVAVSSAVTVGSTSTTIGATVSYFRMIAIIERMIEEGEDGCDY